MRKDFPGVGVYSVFVDIIFIQCVLRYFEELSELKRKAGKVLLTWNELQSGVNRVNLAAQEEHNRKYMLLHSQLVRIFKFFRIFL